jgi:outer membrane protein assembly factor BamB
MGWRAILLPLLWTFVVASPPGICLAASGETTSVYANAARSSEVPDAGVGEQPARAWERDGSAWGYPLVADGRVFVLGWDSAGSGATLYALDAHTGATLWSTPAYNANDPTFDAGKVFVQFSDGRLVAFSADDGHQLWSSQLEGQTHFVDPPTAAGGRVFTIGKSTGTTIYAVDESTGRVDWSHFLNDGGDSPLSVSGNLVYVSMGQPQVYALDTGSGAQSWHYSGHLTGGGGYVPVIYGGRLYTREDYNNGPGYVLDAAGGGYLGGFDADLPPIFSSGLGVFLNDGTMRAENVATGQVIWSQATYVAGEPLVADDVVWFCKPPADILGVRLASGALAFRDTWSSAQDGRCSVSAGDGRLVVAWDGHLVAYQGPDAGSESSGTPPKASSTSRRPRLRIITRRSIRLKALRRRGLPVEVAGVRAHWQIAVKLERHSSLVVTRVTAKARGRKWRTRLHVRPRFAPARRVSLRLVVRVRTTRGRAVHATRRVTVRP